MARNPQNDAIFEALRAPFRQDQIKSRPGQGGRQLLYITATTVEERLDEVLGVDGWEFELKPWGDDALIGTLRVMLPDGSVVSKQSVGGCAQMDADDDSAKSADSDAIKRCAKRFGIGRDLYQSHNGEYDGPRQQSPRPGPQGGHGQAPAPRGGNGGPPQRGPQGGGDGGGWDKPPKTGKALFAWVMDQQANHENGEGLLVKLNAYADRNEIRGKMVSWDDRTVAKVHQYAMGMLEGGDAPAPERQPAPAPAQSRRRPEIPARLGTPAQDDDSDIPF